MEMKITRDVCPVCGEPDDLQRDIFFGYHCYCNVCATTWDYRHGQVWGRDNEGKVTPAQKRIDERRQARRDSGKKWDGANQERG
jgi:hypothetical protein